MTIEDASQLLSNWIQQKPAEVAAQKAAVDHCGMEPQQDFTLPYELPHRGNGYSGSGLWHSPAEPIWSPQPRLGRQILYQRKRAD